MKILRDKTFSDNKKKVVFIEREVDTIGPHPELLTKSKHKNLRDLILKEKVKQDKKKK